MDHHHMTSSPLLHSRPSMIVMMMALTCDICYHLGSTQSIMTEPTTTTTTSVVDR